MAMPPARESHPRLYVRALTQAGRAAKINIPPALARQLGWCLRDLLVVELMPDNTLRIKKLEVAPHRQVIEEQHV